MKSKTEIQKEIVEGLQEPSHGLLRLAPRVGKTKIGIDIIKKEKPKRILWVTPNAKLRDVDIPTEFKVWRALRYLKKTDIICYASLSTHEGRYDKIILDEYQDITISNVLPLLNGKISYETIIGLSGTHPKHREKQEIYDKLNLKFLSDMSIDEAVESNLIAPYRIKVIEIDLNSTNKNVTSGSKDRPFMQTEQEKYTYLSRLIGAKLAQNLVVPKFYYLNRMRFIYNLKSKQDFAKKLISKLEGRTLIFTGTIAQAEDLCENTYHSKTDDAMYNKFLEGKIKNLACVNSGGIGSTYKGVDNFVIVQVNSNGKGDSTQKIARSLVLQEGYVANIYILVAKGTSDEVWKDRVLEDFDISNVEHINSRNYE